MRMNVYLQIFLHNNGQYIYQETNLQNKGVQGIFLHIDFLWLCYLQNKLQNCDLRIHHHTIHLHDQPTNQCLRNLQHMHLEYHLCKEVHHLFLGKLLSISSFYHAYSKMGLYDLGIFKDKYDSHRIYKAQFKDNL